MTCAPWRLQTLLHVFCRCFSNNYRVGGLLGHSIKLSCGCDDFLTGGWRFSGHSCFLRVHVLEAPNIASFVLLLFHWFVFRTARSDESSYGTFMLVRRVSDRHVVLIEEHV